MVRRRAALGQAVRERRAAAGRDRLRRALERDGEGGARRVRGEGAPGALGGAEQEPRDDIGDERKRNLQQEPWNERGRFDGLPDVHYGDARHVIGTDGDIGVTKWTLTGTNREGRTEVNGCDFYTFREGKVVRKDSYWKIVE